MTDQTAKTAVAIAKVICLLSAAAAFIGILLLTQFATREMPGIVHSEVAAVRQELTEQVVATRIDLTGQIADTRAQVLALTDKHLVAIESSLNGQLDQIAGDLNGRLDDTNRTLQETAAQIRPVSLSLSSVLAKIDQQEPAVYARFRAQEPMIYSRYLAVSGEAMRTLDAGRKVSEEVAKIAPDLGSSAVTTSGNVAAITGDIHEYTKPKKKGFVTGTLIPIVLSSARLIF